MVFSSTLIALVFLSASYRTSAVTLPAPTPGLSGIICNPANLHIKPVSRWMVQQAIDEWESRPSPNIEVVPAEQEWRLGYAPIGTVIDNLEVAAGLGYSNVGKNDVTVTIKAPDGDSLLITANEMISKCWGQDKDKDKDKMASAQYFFGESGNNLVIRQICRTPGKDEWNNCDQTWTHQTY